MSHKAAKRLRLGLHDAVEEACRVAYGRVMDSCARDGMFDRARDAGLGEPEDWVPTEPEIRAVAAQERCEHGFEPLILCATCLGYLTLALVLQKIAHFKGFPLSEDEAEELAFDMVASDFKPREDCR